jgi:hypothetical protein
VHLVAEAAASGKKRQQTHKKQRYRGSLQAPR